MPFDLSHPDRPIHVGVVLMNAEIELLDIAPVDMLNGMDKKFMSELPIPDHLKEQALDCVFHWVNEDGKTANLTAGITIQCTDSFETCPPLDIVLLGAHEFGYNPNNAELAFLRKAHEDCSAFITICGGFDAPVRAGVLQGKRATAPRFLIEKLRSDAPGTDWQEKRWVHDGKVWTSGALLNGLDLMAAFVKETWSDRMEMVQTMLELGAWPVRDAEYPN